jgi:hypothetical protein
LCVLRPRYRPPRGGRPEPICGGTTPWNSYPSGLHYSLCERTSPGFRPPPHGDPRGASAGSPVQVVMGERAYTYTLPSSPDGPRGSEVRTPRDSAGIDRKDLLKEVASVNSRPLAVAPVG